MYVYIFIKLDITNRAIRPCHPSHSFYNATRPVQRLGGGGCNIFVPVLGGNGTKLAPTGDMFDQLPGQMR